MNGKPLVRSCIVALLGAALARCDETPQPAPHALQLSVTELVDEGVRREVSVIGPRGADLSVSGVTRGVDVFVDDVLTLRLMPPDLAARYTPTAPDGASLQLFARDDDGRESMPLVLAVDRAAPVVVAATPPTGARVAEVREIAFTLGDQSRVDFFGSPLRVSIGTRTLLEGTDFDRVARPPATLALVLRGALDGTLRAKLVTADVVGNVAALPFAYVLEIDQSPPAFTFRTPLAGQVVTGVFELAIDAASDTRAVGWALTDVAGNRRTGALALASEGPIWRATLDPHGLSDGPLTLKVTAVDGVDNAATQELAPLTLAGKGPSLVAIEPPLGAWVAENVPMRAQASSPQDRVARLEARDAEGGLIAAISFNQDGYIAAGITPPPVTLTLVDAAQRKTVVGTGWRLDTRPPQLVWSPTPTALDGAPLGVPPAIVPIVLDAESGANQAATLVSFVVTPPPGGRAGIWRARAVPVDMVGNAGPEASATWVVDGEAPRVLFDAPVDGGYVGVRAAIVARLTDDDRVAEASIAAVDADGQGTSRQGLVPGADGVVRASLALGGLAEGPVTLRVEARDRAGLAGSAAVRVALDRTPPTIEPLAALPRIPAWIGAEGSAAFRVRDAGAGLGAVRVRREGDALALAMPLIGDVAVVTLDAGDAPHGTLQTWLVSASDAVGNSAELAVSARIDRVPPVAALSAVPAVVATFPDLSVVLADDGSGVDIDDETLVVSRDDVPTQDAALVPLDEPGLFAIAIADPEPGHWSVRVVPRDHVGLVGDAASVTFTWDPSAAPIAPSFAAPSTAGADAVAVFADVDDDRWPDLQVVRRDGLGPARDWLYLNLGLDAVGHWRGFQRVDAAAFFAAFDARAMGPDP